MKLRVVLYVIVVLLASYAGLVISSLNMISIVGFKTESIKFDNTGLYITGDLILNNDGFLPVSVKKADFIFLFDDKELYSGVLKGGELKVNENTSLYLESKINWVPSFELVTELISDNPILLLETNVTVEYLFFDTDLTHQEEIDIKPLLTSYLREQASNVLNWL